MDNFRLKVFMSVATNKSFTKAASELFITQPAITKHIKLLEESLETRLFDRSNHQINLTKAGEIVYKYGIEIIQLYKDIQIEIAAQKNEFKGQFRLGASTTIAQYLLAPVLASFFEKFPQIELSLLNGNTEQIEHAILNNQLDLGIVEGVSHTLGIKYIDFTEDELVPVVHTKSRYAKLNFMEIDELVSMPLVLRERGSGTLDVLEKFLKEKGLKLSSLNVIMHLGSTESIKSFLEYSNCVSFMSIRAIKKELERNEMKILSIKDFSIKRQFSFIHLKGQPNAIASTFIRFYMKHHNQML
jgi:LysR family transcriptional regulator, transcriptional activator of the cysJI operon